MNIIIPLGGLGDRFKKENYLEPKPLIKIFGKAMIFHVIDNLKLEDNDNLIIIYNKDLNKYNFCDIINNKYLFSNKIIFIELHKQTEGAAETILYGLKNIRPELLELKCVLLDCDTFYHIDILSTYRKQNNNAVFCFKDEKEKPIYSYVNINKDNIITEIKEKKKISNYANTGCYCFSSGLVLSNYCQKILEINKRENNEYYTSCVIDLMINDNFIFNANIIDYDDFTCVGTPFQLKIYCTDIINHSEKKRFCFDLDNTLVTFPKVKGDYTTVEPILRNIEILKYLKNLGHTIIIHTARRMKTHNGNVGAVISDIAQLTLDTLKKYDIEYDELYFGKPYADFYIDDLAVNAFADLEKELGFYKTSIVERDFNEIISSKMEIIIKKSNDEKIKGEIHYYQNIPNEFKKYFPLFIDFGSNWYSMEKIKGIPLSYLYVSESITEEIFIKFLDIFKTIHSKKKENCALSFRIFPIENTIIFKHYINKLKSRYTSYNYLNYNNAESVYKYLLDFLDQYKLNNKVELCMIHGDPVFSNCLLSNNNDFKLIDMRGKLDNELTIYGDIFYDYAKIYQSLIGYDEILLDKYVSNNYRMKMNNIFNNYIIKNYGKKYIEIIKNITNYLLFTLIPLHNNDKCLKYYNLIQI